MADGVNRVTLVGNIGADLDVRYSPAGKAVVEVRLATTESWKDGQGNKNEHVEWHRVVFFGKSAEILGEYASKGRQLYVEGRIRTEEYEKGGIKRYSVKIMGDEFRLLGGRSGSDSAAPASRGPSGGAPRGASAPRGPERTPVPSAARHDDFDDDIIPF